MDLAPETTDSARRRRHAAGEDPRKRDQIIDGAREVFLEQGFDAASMNDICRAAGVSKGTLYVYFQNKEDLFVALVEEERNRIFATLDPLLDADLPIEERLRLYARRLAEALCSDGVVRAQRIIVGIAERMPDLGARFVDGVMQRPLARIAGLLARETASGRLRVPDPEMAAMQLVELATAGLWRRRLFGKIPSAPPAETTDAVADAGVRVFLAAYGPGGAP